ncbi:YncE family protein [Gordonia sp. ABSL1-1]|uniref:YncE family protein n=1 Tax=Gordonia sp. ABSL1-1 TaxID=3053923 RepID=UPI0025733575|nr:YncE family protein [Gordonia sp. ABSL1-1]MDL9937470.1 YncE family protein [Gordonia sp. ABSL1-1]
MKIRMDRTLKVVGTAVATATAAAAFVVAPVADAAPTGYTFTVSSAQGGVDSGSELALDSGRNELFITDNNSYLATKGGTDFQIKTDPIDPKVSVFDTVTRRPVRSIKYAAQPLGVMVVGPVPLIPIAQVPDGIALDTKRGRVLTTNSHANGITIVGMNERAATARNLISVPGSHPMGITVNPGNGLAYVALNYINQLALIDTNARREVGRIPTFAPSIIDLDVKRHRLYIGNADNAKKTNYVAVLDTRTNKIIKRISTPANSRPEVDPVTGRVYAASFDTGKVSVIDPQTLTVVKTIETKGSPNKLAIDAERRLLYLSNLQKRSLTIIDLTTERVIKTLPVNGPIHSIVVDQKTGTLYGTQHQSGTLTIVKVS